MKKTHLLIAGSAISLAFFITMPSYAQDMQQDETPAAKAANTAAANDSSIIVTGSRIRRDKFSGADPIQIFTKDEATQAGFNSTSEILQSVAITGGTDQINDAYGGFVVNGGPGVNTVSLRGLGTTRTLVLLNGRRVSPAGSRGSVGSADLNVLPNALIDRVEILNTGASSIYGSDAVAGVINIVTRNKMDGLTFEAQHNVLEAGAGNSRRYSLSGGFEANGFSFIGSLEYYNREALEFGDREFSSCPRGLYGTDGSNYGAADFVDARTGQVRCFPLENGGVTINTIGLPDRLGGTVALAPGIASNYNGPCNRFRPLAGASGAVPGYECVGGGTLSTNIRDTFSPYHLAQDLLSPAEIYTGFGRLAYESDILGNAEFYVDLLLNRRNSNQDGQRQFTIDYPLGSPLVPASLTFPTRFLGASAPLNYEVGVRVFADYGIYNNRQTVDFARLNSGIRGDLPNDWRYDFFAGKSWSDSTYTTDLILSDRFRQSMFVTPNGSGGFNCTVTTVGCVAAPRLTADVVGGNFPGSWIDYITEPVVGNTKYTETTLALGIDGPLFALPGGSIQLAAGVEYRKAKIDDTPDPNSQRGNLYGFSSSTITRGSDSVWEGFGEIELPLLADVPLAHELTVNASARYTEYKSYGGQETYKVGGIYSPFRWLGFRGSYGTSYRAPALFEQFLGATSGFLSNNSDPCNNLGSVTNPLIKSQCLANGLPDASPSLPNGFQQNNSITVIGLGGAAAGLKAETSKATTYGFIFQPKLSDHFGQISLAVDYFKVKIDNGVSQLSAASVLSQCYNNPERKTCSGGLITRDPYTGPGSGRLTVIQSYVNISDAKAEGIDFTLRYTRPLLGGDFRFNAQATQFIDRYSRTLPTQAIRDVIGLIENPKWTGSFDAQFGRNGWNVRYGVEWIDATDSQAYGATLSLPETRYKLKTPDYFLHTASVRYKAEKFGITLGVRNIFDTDPPTMSADYGTLRGNAPLYSGYDLRGRSFFVNLSAGI